MLPHPATVCVIRALHDQERLQAIAHERHATTTEAEPAAAHAASESLLSMRHRGRQASMVVRRAGLILADEMLRSPRAPDA